MSKRTSTNVTPLFLDENMAIEHKFTKGQLVKYITDHDYTESEINEMKPIMQSLYSGMPFFVLEETRDCDGTPLYTLSIQPFESVQAINSYVATKTIPEDILKKLNNIEGCILIVNTSNLLYVSGISEDNLRSAH